MHIQDTLVIGNSHESYYLHASDILYVEADGNYCNIYLTDGEVISSILMQIGEIARRIDRMRRDGAPPMFVRVGRSYIISVSHIQHIHPVKRQLKLDLSDLATGTKHRLSASTKALQTLRADMDTGSLSRASRVCQPPAVANGRGGFGEYLSSSSNMHTYEQDDDCIMYLG